MKSHPGQMILAPMLLIGCITAPAGYKRLGDFSVCAKEGVNSRSLGEGSVFGGTSLYGEIEIPWTDLELQSPDQSKALELSLSKRQPLSDLTNGLNWDSAKKDSERNFAKIETDSHSFYRTTHGKSEITWVCSKSDSSSIQEESCARIQSLGNVFALTPGVKLQNAPAYDAAVQKSFDKKLLTTCE